MAEKTSAQLAEIITLLRELKLDIKEVRTDFDSLKEKLEASTKPRPKRAIITAPSIDGWDEDTIELSAEEWALVKGGERVIVTNEIEFGGGPLRSHWEFCGGIGGTIKRDVEWHEGDIETEYENTLVKSDVEEFDDPS